MTNSHYFDADAGGSSKPKTIDIKLGSLAFTLTTDRGVFAGSGLDSGTRALLEEGPESVGSLLVDLGSGYGPIACTLAMRRPDARIYAVDINERANLLCQQNATALGLTNITVGVPPSGELIDELWSNPPIRVGKAALYELLDEWLARLAPTGRALLVVQKHLGADSLQKDYIARGFGVKRLASKRGFRILEVRPNS
jgi:16S rRNA G1207 methylase RsmC